MDALKQELLSTEDEILVGLSNKGIVKRAYKDLEQEHPAVCWNGEEAKVTFKDAECVIRLPLADSTCSCPSRSMCRHRIAAILWLKRECDSEAQAFSKEELKAKREAVPDKKQEEKPEEKPKAEKKINEAKAAELAAAWKEALLVQFSTGLTRLSQETEESLERLAVLSHRAEFAQLEKAAREAGSLYRQYFSRAAAFRTESLMRKLIQIYSQTETLEQAKTQEELRELAGTFRDSYETVGELSLIGVGTRNFQSGSGYEGEIYYFLEETQGKWYTWTDARPVFYEGRRRPLNSGGQQAAPWELNCNREQLSELGIHLANAKAARGNRLSVSQETKGEISGSKAQYRSVLDEKTIWDYRLLLEQYFAKPSEEMEETDCLALVGAKCVGDTVFDETKQRFYLPLYDWEGRRMDISLRYSKEEKYTIRLLERLQKRLKEQRGNGFAFFGRLYLEDGKLVLYPIEFFEEVSLPDEIKISGQIEKTDDTKNLKESVEEKFNKAEADGKTDVEPDVLEEFTRYFAEAERTLSDLFQGGLDSVLEPTIQEIGRLGKDGEELGLHLAGEKFSAMAEMLQAKRHQMSFQPEPILKIWAEVMEYLNICGELIARDTAYLAMKQEMRKENGR